MHLMLSFSLFWFVFSFFHGLQYLFGRIENGLVHQYLSTIRWKCKGLKIYSDLFEYHLVCTQ